MLYDVCIAAQCAETDHSSIQADTMGQLLRLGFNQIQWIMGQGNEHTWRVEIDNDDDASKSLLILSFNRISTRYYDGIKQQIGALEVAHNLKINELRKRLTLNPKKANEFVFDPHDITG